MADTQEKAAKAEKSDKADKAERAHKAEKAERARKAKGATSAPEAPVFPDEPGEPAPVPRLQIAYAEKVRPALARQFGLVNPHEIPRVTKIVLNVGFGEGPKVPKALEAI